MFKKINTSKPLHMLEFETNARPPCRKVYLVAVGILTAPISRLSRSSA